MKKYLLILGFACGFAFPGQSPAMGKKPLPPIPYHSGPTSEAQMGENHFAVFINSWDIDPTSPQSGLVRGSGPSSDVDFSFSGQYCTYQFRFNTVEGGVRISHEDSGYWNSGCQRLRYELQTCHAAGHSLRFYVNKFSWELSAYSCR